MEQRRGHPLDIDLLGVALGDADAELAAGIAEHLGTCLLCRVRIARLRRSDAVPSAPPTGIDHPSVSPEVLAVLGDDGASVRPDAVAPGQVWLAGDSRRLLIWVRAVRPDRVVAHPVTTDVDAADDTGLIADLPALGGPVAVVTSIVGTVPVGGLVAHVGELDVRDDIERLRDAATAGTAELDLPTGRPITGPTDERLEFRQLLADDMAALDSIEDEEHAFGGDGADTAEAAARHMYETLRSDLLARRGAGCEVRTPAGDLALGAFAESTGCVPVALVTELTTSVLLITGDGRLAWALAHPDEASKLLRLAGATALAVAESDEPYTTCLFEERHLHPALELPRAVAAVGPRPGWGPKPMVKALFDYLEDGVFAVEPVPGLGPPAGERDLLPALRSNARQSVAELRKARAQLTKNAALKSLKRGDADALAKALDGAADLDDLLRLLERITER